MTTGGRFRERLAPLPTGSARRTVPVVLGSVLAPLGLLLIVLAWVGASRTPLVQEQLSYLISGGLLGLALVVLGGFCYFAHWQTEVLREIRIQTAEVTAALRAGARPTSADDVAVMTAEGTLAHRPGCPVVRDRKDVRPATADLPPCTICEPVLTIV